MVHFNMGEKIYTLENVIGKFRIQIETNKRIGSVIMRFILRDCAVVKVKNKHSHYTPTDQPHRTTQRANTMMTAILLVLLFYEWH